MSLQLRKRHRRPAGLSLAALMVLVLSGCSTEQKDQIKRLALPVPASKEAGYVYDLWHVVLAGRRCDRPGHAGPDPLRRRPLPPPQRDRGAGADALQPADRGALHDRPGDDRGRLLLLHRQGAEPHRPRRPQRRLDDHGRGAAVVVDVQLQPRLRRPRPTPTSRSAARPVFDAGTTAQRPDAVAGQGQVGPGLPVLARRHPLVLGAGVPLQDGRRARAAQPLRVHPDQRSAPSRAAAPSSAASTTRGCCSTSRWSTRRPTTPT